jgi:hypothetical protein
MSNGMVKAYQRCPTLTWLIANRVCSKLEASEAWVSFTGRKGIGKSTASISFCESLAEDVARVRGLGEDPTKFFNADHIKSITAEGAADLLSSGGMQQENSIWLIDDAGTQISARNALSVINKVVASIAQISRVYKNIVILNFIASKHIDVLLRGLVDYRAEMQYKNVYTGQAFFKFFYLENTEFGEYKHYLTWHGKRITTWIIEKPSEELYKTYEQMRRSNTDLYIESQREKLQKKLGISEPKEKPEHPMILNNRDKVLSLKEKGLKTSEICRKSGTPRYWVEKILVQSGAAA